MLQHHDARQEQCRGIRKPFARNVWRGAVDGFEDGALVADVAGWSQAEAADQAGAHVREDVSVEVRHHQDLVVVGRRVGDDLEARVVKQLSVELDLGEFLGDLPGNVKEQAVGHLHDGSFVHGADLAFADVLGVLEGEAQHSLRGGARDEFDALHNAVNDYVLDPGVLAFGVFADEDRVDVVVWGLVAGYGNAGADVCEKVEGAAEGEIEGDVTFTDGGLGGLGQTLKRDTE